MSPSVHASDWFFPACCYSVRQIYWLQHCKRLADWLVCSFIGWCGLGVSYNDTCVYCLLLFLWPGLRVSPIPQPAVSLHSQRCQRAKFCPRSHKHPLPPAETSDWCHCGGREKKKKKVVLRLSFCWSLSLSLFWWVLTMTWLDCWLWWG